jgi:hypothetical protein
MRAAQTWFSAPSTVAASPIEGLLSSPTVPEEGRLKPKRRGRPITDPKWEAERFIRWWKRKHNKWGELRKPYFKK